MRWWSLLINSRHLPIVHWLIELSTTTDDRIICASMVLFFITWWSCWVPAHLSQAYTRALGGTFVLSMVINSARGGMRHGRCRVKNTGVNCLELNSWGGGGGGGDRRSSLMVCRKQKVLVRTWMRSVGSVTLETSWDCIGCDGVIYRGEFRLFVNWERIRYNCS